jgi:hypothetical protein
MFARLSWQVSLSRSGESRLFSLVSPLLLSQIFGFLEDEPLPYYIITEDYLRQMVFLIQ